MKIFFRISAVVGILVLCSPLALGHAATKTQQTVPGATQEQRLQSTLQWAFAYNPSLKVAQEALLAATEDVSRARSGYFPTVGVYAGTGFTQNDNAATRDRGQERQTYGTTSASLRLRVPVWEGGTTQAQVTTRTASSQSADALVDDSGATLALSALASHIDVKRRLLLLGFARKNVQEHESIHKAVQQRYAQGIATTGEVNQIAARLHRAIAMRSMYQASLEVARANFVRVTGKTAPADLQRVELPLKLFPTASEVREVALTNNPRILSGLATIRAMLGEKDYARAGLNPKITVDAGPAIQTMGTSNGHSAEWQTMLNLAWEFNTGGGEFANIRAASARVRQSKQELHVYMDTLNEDIESSFSRLISTRQQSSEMGRAKQAALVAREDFYQQFLAGQRGLLDVLDAASEYFSYASDEELTRTDSIILAYRLLALSGQLLPELHIDPAGLRTKNATTPDVDTASDTTAWSTLNRKLQEK